MTVSPKMIEAGVRIHNTHRPCRNPVLTELLTDTYLAMREHDPDFVSWQAIDTAPKDGSSIWGWMRIGFDGAYFQDVMKWLPTPSGGFWVTHAMPVHPTHWMPLPEPPASDLAAQKHQRAREEYAGLKGGDYSELPL